MIHVLTCHPATPPRRITAVHAEWRLDENRHAALVFTVDGAEALFASPPALPERTDGLWRTTCFELFWKPMGGEGYVEFNLSPSTRWAAYAFDGYRAGMRDLTLPRDPGIERLVDGIHARLDLSAIPRGPAQVGFSAVIEETDGAKSYWALAHPPGAPDFHHADCFALRIPAVA